MTILQKDELQTLIIMIKNFMEDIKPQDRIDLISRIMEKYCPNCGHATNGKHCYCMNDE